MLFAYPIVKQGATKVMESDKINKVSKILDTYLDEKLKELQEKN